jgi:hypothetical protein
MSWLNLIETDVVQGQFRQSRSYQTIFILILEKLWGSTDSSNTFGSEQESAEVPNR